MYRSPKYPKSSTLIKVSDDLTTHLNLTEHVPAPLLGPHGLGVTKLHLEQLRGPQHGGQLVPRLEELAAGEDLGQQAAVGPHVRRGARPRRGGRCEASSVPHHGFTPRFPPDLDIVIPYFVNGLIFDIYY